MGYTKLDSGITESTIWQASDATRLVWITLLARADQNGYVGASMPGLAGLARVSLADCIAAIEQLEAPDEWSRTKDHEGRRIAPADGGWVLLNHAKYRAKQNADDRRERSRVAMAELRSRRKQEVTVSTSYQSYPKLSQAEAEAEAENTNTVSRFALFWSRWPSTPRKVGKKQCEAKWKSQHCEDSFDAIMAALDWFIASDQWSKDNRAFVPMPSTWLNRRSWEIDIPKPKPTAVDDSAEVLRCMEEDRIASRSQASIEARNRALSALKVVGK